MASVECLQDAVRMLVAERQALRERDAGRDELESTGSSSPAGNGISPMR